MSLFVNNLSPISFELESFSCLDEDMERIVCLYQDSQIGQIDTKVVDDPSHQGFFANKAVAADT